MKTIQRTYLWLTLAATILLLPRTGKADNVCIEFGPVAGPWNCLGSGSNTTSGALSFTEVSGCIGDPVTGPILSAQPTFANGAMRRSVSTTCPTNMSYWQTNSLRYIAGPLYFSPPLPATITEGLSGVYTGKVDAVPSSLLAWWPGNSSTEERIYGNQCILSNGATYATGKVGDGFSLDGVNDQVIVPDSPYLNIGSSNHFSMECWINASSNSIYLPIVDKRGYVNGRLQGYFLTLNGGKPYFAIYSSSGSFGVSATASSNLLDSVFHHVAVTVDRTSTTGGKIYVDGALKLTFNPVGAVGDLSNPNPLRIGSYFTGGTYFFKGRIDEVSLYQCAISSNDVAAIYNAGSAGKWWTNSATGAAPLPTGCLCNSVTATVGTLTITAGGDSDYDGICDCQETIDGTDPANPASVRPVQLGSWRFDDTNWTGLQGQVPLVASNLALVTGLSQKAVLVNSANPASLVYKDVEDCYGNVNCRNGSVRFWFRPGWNSATNGGPQSEARLLELGSQGSPDGWWSLLINSTGTNLYLVTQTNGVATTNFQRNISWNSNEWHQVVLTYSSNSSALYLDGVGVVTNGAGVTKWPSLTSRSQGFRIGSSIAGANQVKGRFENLETYNYVLTLSEIEAGYSSPCWSALDTALVVDRSSSMNTVMSDGNTRLAAAKTACSNFVNNLNFTTDQAALFTFDSAVVTNRLLTNSAASLLQAIGQISPGSGTYMSNAIVKAQNELQSSRHNLDALPVMVFLSDGEPSDSTNNIMAVATQAKNAGTRLITVALSTSAGTNLLKAMASPDSYYFATNSAQLSGVYDLIANTLCRGTNLAPVVSIQSPTNGQSYLAPTNIAVTVTASDPENGLVKVELYGNNVKVDESYHSSTNNLFAFTWNNAPAGTNTLKAVAWDESGLSTTSSVVSIVVVSPVTLAVTLTAPANGSVFQEPASIPMSASVSGGTAAKVEFYANGLKIGEDAVSSGNPYTYTWSGVTNNGSNYVLTARAIPFSGSSVTSTGVTVTVISALSVNAGSNQVVVLNGLSATNTLRATILGGYGSITSQWSQVVGPANAIFASPGATNTLTTYTNQVGNYVFQFTAQDGYSLASGLVSVSVLTNQGPVVTAGPNRIIETNAPAYLNGAAEDDGLPLPPNLITWWSVISKPTNSGTLLFANSNAPVTVVSNFTVQGIYTLALNASDGWVTNSSVMTVTVADPSSRTYTLSADFAEGEMVNLNFDVPNQLQLNRTTTPFPYVWVACSARDTAVRIDANTGQIIGEYSTAPSNTSVDPSRTTVDKYGNVWVCNRDSIGMPDGSSKGSVVRIGLVIGGTRGRLEYVTNGLLITTNFVADPAGEYLQPPFKYCTAVDRDGDGLIRTSRGLGHILEWGTSRGANEFGGVSSADDECIINYTRVAATGTRTIAIDANNDIWVGGTGNSVHEKVSGISGLPIPDTDFKMKGGGYGGLIDGNGLLWSMTLGAGPVRFDIARRFDFSVMPPLDIAPTYPGDQIAAGGYGMGIDPQTGNIWSASGSTVSRISPDGLHVDSFVNPGGSAGGVAVDGRGNVWVASHGGANFIAHFRTDGAFVGLIDLGCVTEGPTGVAVDANGKIWSANMGTSAAMRFDPTKGPRMLNGVLNPNGYPLGEADMKVNLNTGEPGETAASPYNYSDMTGFVSLGATEPSGIWRVVHDSGLTNRAWGIVKWSGSEPLGTKIKVEVRAADRDSDLTATNRLFVEVLNGQPFTNIVGRFVEIRATLSHRQGTNASPLLYDLSISTGTNVVIASAAEFAQDDRVTMFENSGAHLLDVLANDAAPSGTNLVITKVSPAGNGVVAIGSVATNLIYTPNTNFFGVDQFSYTVSDRQGGLGRAVVTVVVGESVEEPELNTFAPVAVNDTNVIIHGNGPTQFIDVLANDFDTNALPQTNIFITAVTQAGHGFVRATGCGIEYTPYADHFGSDQFTYTIGNLHGWTATATVRLSVVGQPINISCGFITSRLFLTNNSAYSTNTPGQFVHVYKFVGDPTKVVSFDIHDANGVYYSWQVYDPQGQLVNAPLVPRSTGTYTLEVSISPSQVGAGGHAYSLTNACAITNLPHMAVLFDGVTVPSGVGGIDFGTQRMGQPATALLTITNYGEASLSLSYVDPNLVVGGITNFTVGGTQLTNQNVTPITLLPHGATNLTVRFEAARLGTNATTLYLGNDDPDYQSSSYRVLLMGVVIPTNTQPPTVSLIAPSTNAQYASFKTSSQCGSQPIQIVAQAAAAADGAIRVVNFYARTTNGNIILIGQDFDTNAMGNYEMNWLDVPPGTYQLMAVAIDDSGLQTASDQVPVSVALRSAASPQMRWLFGGTNNLTYGSGIDFGLNLTNTTRTVSITVTNLGPGKLTNWLPDLTGAFYFTNNPAGATGMFVLNANKSTNVTLAFRSASLGNSDATLDLENNDEGLWYSQGSGDCEKPGRLRLYLSGTTTNLNSGPTVSWTNVVSGTNLIAPANINLAAVAKTDGSTSVEYVDFYLVTAAGNSLIGRGNNYSGDVFEYAWEGIVTGQYNLIAVAVDHIGRRTISSQVTLNVLLRPPTSPILLVRLGADPVPDFATINYGIVNVGSSSPTTLVVSNGGNASLTLTNFGIEDWTGSFSLSNAPAFPLTIAANKSTNLYVWFAPQYQGELTGVLTITNGDVAMNPFVITNIGRGNPAGTAPTVVITQPSSGQTVNWPRSVIATSALGSGNYIYVVDFYAQATNGNYLFLGQAYYPDGPNYAATNDWTAVPIPPGNYTLRAVATDDGGRQGLSAGVQVTVPLRGANSPNLKVLLGTNDVANGSTIFFGTVPVNTLVSATLTITNAGPIAFTNTSLGLVSGGGDFLLPESFPQGGFELEPGAWTNLVVSFNASSSGGYTNLLRFDGNDDALRLTLGKFSLNLMAVATNSYLSIALTKPINNSTSIIPNAVEFEAVVTANVNSSIQVVNFYATGTNGDDYLGQGVLNGSKYVFAWTNATPGQYSVRAVAVDSYGISVSSATVPITVLLRPANSPVLQVLMDQTNSLPNHATVDYGIGQVGVVLTNALTLTNSGNAELLISKFIVSNPDDFAIAASFDLPLTPFDPPLTIPVGGSTNVNFIFKARAQGEATSVLTIYHNDVATHPYALTNVARANPVNSTGPTVQLTAPADGATIAYPGDVTLSAIAASATNATLAAVDFYAVDPTGTVRIGQVMAAAGQTNLIATATWLRPSPGTHRIKAVATDSSGLVGESSIRTISVIDPDSGSTNPPLPNLPPIAADDHLYILGCANATNCPTYVINVLANDSDPNGDPITVTGFNRGSGRLGPIVQDGNRLLFFPNPLIEGTNWVSYTVSDGRGGSATGWIEIRMKMTPLPTVILVSPLDNALIDLPVRPTNLPLVVYAKASNTNLSIARVSVYRNSETTVEAEDPWDPPYEVLSDRLLIGSATVTNGAPYTYIIPWASPPAGTHRLTAYAIDSAGQENLSGAYIDGNIITSQGNVITIAGNSNNIPPTAAITNLVAGTNDVNGIPSLVYPIVTNGVIDVRGLARDDNAGDPVSYQLLLQKPDGTVVAELTPQTLLTNGFHFGTDDNGILATNVDLTVYENGPYDIVLNVFDGWEVSSDSARILLDTQLKVGQFSFSVQDVTIPVSGIPLTVTRTYNSFNHESGDFGYSWTYALSDMQVDLDEVRERTPDLFEEDSDGGSFSLRVGGGRDVTLTLPDGQRTTFQFYFGEPEACNQGDPIDACYPALWQAPPGINYTLTSLAGTNYYNGITGYWNNQAGTGFENYDFPGWILTAQDGTRFIIRREDTGEHFFFSGYNDDYYAETYGEPYLAEIIQRDTNRIVFASDRVQHYDPQGNPTRAITFDRDSQNRIIAVRDPNSGTNGLPVVKYVYNTTNGNLMQVDKLVERSPITYESTFYSYTNANFPHYLTGIIDPRGVKVAKTYYDEDGRISAVEDADGKLTRFFHNLDSKLEVVTDRMGNTNSFVYDLRGNVVISTNAGVVTTMSYDGANRLLTQTNAFGTPQATWTLYAYDGNGFQTNVITSPDHTNSFLYTDKGELLWHTDPIGNKTENRYDSSGNLTNTIQYNALGQIIEQSFSKYVDGKLVETRNGNGVVTSSFGYDASGNLTNTLDANGVARSFTYDANGNQTSSTYYYQGNPVTATSLYDAAGRVTMSIDADGNTNRTVYNALGKVDNSTDRYGHVSRFLYDARGNLIQTTHADGITTRTVYDANARPILTTDRNQVTGTRTFYDEAGWVTNTVRRLNCRIDIVADTANSGQVKSVIGAEGSGLATNVTEYLVSGWVKSRTDASGAKTTYDYWPDGQTKTVTDALTNITCFKYDLAGRQEYVVDALNRTNRFEYDGAGRNIKTIYANGTFTTNGFNNLGQRTVTRDQGGLLTQFAYDTSGQMTNVTKPQVPNPEASYAMQSPSWGYQYDAYGRLTVTVDPKGRGTTNTYDALGREVKRSLPLGQTSTNLYYTNTAARGQLWKSYDLKGQRTEFVYDNFGRVKAKYRFDVNASSPSNSVSYEYNSMGQLQQVIERYGTNAATGYQSFAFWWPGPGGGERWFARAVRLVPAEMWGVVVGLLMLALGIWSIPMELRRRLVLELRAGWFEVAQTVRLLWEQGRSRRLRLPSLFWRAVSLFTLVCVIGTDPNFDRLMNAQAACNIPTNDSTETTRITTFGYDLEGRLAQVNTPEGVINYEYDLATGRHTSTCTAYSKVVYEYDVLGRLAKVKVVTRNGSDLITPEETLYTYTKVGSRETVTLPNGVKTTYVYDNLNRLTSLTNRAGDGTVLSQFSYLLHETGRRTNAMEILKQEDGPYQTNTFNWAYDGLYRLTNETCVATAGGSYTNAYEYDLVGNRLKQVSLSGAGTKTTVSAYNANDHLQTEITSGSAVSTNSYTYDLNGSVVAKTNNANGTITYAYDLANKLKSVTANSITTSYQYNDSGIRVRSITAASTNYFLVDGNNHTGYAQVLEERSTLGAAPAQSYVLGDDVLAQGVSGASYLLYDGHGSTRQMANASGGVTSRYNYDAYGQKLGTSTTTAETSLLYCGEQYDSTLEMYNLRARFYDPSNGRFNAMDTFRGSNEDPQTLHKYGYTHCDPVNAVDPSGNMSTVEIGVVIGVAAICTNIVLTVIWGVKHNLTAGQIMGNIVLNLLVFGLIALTFASSPIIAIGAALILFGLAIKGAYDLVQALRNNQLDAWDIAIILGLMLTYMGFARGVGMVRGPINWDSPTDTNFSQRSVKNDNHTKTMEEGGWDWTRPDAPMDRVITPSGRKVSIDNRRLLGAKTAKMKKVPFRDHQMKDPLPEEWLNDPYWSGKGAKTWGDVLRIRTENNKLPIEGTSDLPQVKGK